MGQRSAGGLPAQFLKKAERNDVDAFFDLADWDVLTKITEERYDVL